MKKIWCQRALIFLTLFLLATVSVAQDWKGRGRLQGRVLGPDNQPVANAKITLLRGGEEGSGPEPFYTNKKGRWAYTGLSTGSWNVWIDAEGLQSAETIVQVNEYASPKPVEVTLGVDQAAVAEQKGDELMMLLQEANRLAQEGKYAESRAKYEIIMAEAKDEAQQIQLKMGIAQTYLAEENHAEALVRFNALLPLLEEEQKPAVLRSIAQAQYQAGQVDQSIASLEKILEAQPDDVETMRLLINLLISENREQDAKVYMARLPEGEKVDADALLNLGIEAYNGGNLDEALAHFDKVVADYPDNADAFYFRGLTYLGKGETDPSVADFERMLEIAPDHDKVGEVKEYLAYLKSQ